MTPLLFLDFDGVINTHEYAISNPVRTLDPSKMSIINQLVCRTDAQIVLTTAWRHPGGLTGEILQVLSKAGLDEPYKRVVGQTPYLGTTRGAEIETWLRYEDRAEVDICILDDINDMGTYLQRFLVQTNPTTGITAADAWMALCLLVPLPAVYNQQKRVAV